MALTISSHWNQILVPKSLAWLGAMLVCIAPFRIDYIDGKTLIIVGLIILTGQAYRLKAYNIAICNAVGILGYMFALIT